MIRKDDTEQAAVVPALMPTAISKNRLSKLYGKFQKVSHTISGFILFLFECFVTGRKSDRRQISSKSSMAYLPDDVLLMVIGSCDATTCLALRAASSRFSRLVSRGAKSRMKIIGGVEMLRTPSQIGSEDRTIGNPGLDECIHLKRTQSNRSISLLPAGLIKLMKLISVFHSFKMSEIDYDEVVEAAILNTEFKCINDFILDKVGSFSADSLLRLVRKVSPANILKIRFCPMSAKDDHNAVTVVTINECRARTVTIEADSSLVFSRLDDSALVDLVLWEELCFRTVHLPMCSITHDGICLAALKFYQKCCDILDEMESTMLLPRSQFIITIPESSFIQRDLLALDDEVLPFSKLFYFEKGGFILEIRVQLMALRIIVQSVEMTDIL